MLAIRKKTLFKRDFKRLLGSGKDIEKLLNIINQLAEGRKLAPPNVMIIC